MLVATRVLVEPWPEACWWLFQSSLIGWQAEQSWAGGPSPTALLAPDLDLRQGPTFKFPTFMFVLLHLDSCKSLPSDVQVKRKGNGNPSWGQEYNLICRRENGSLSKSSLITGRLISLPKDINSSFWRVKKFCRLFVGIMLNQTITCCNWGNRLLQYSTPFACLVILFQCFFVGKEII